MGPGILGSLGAMLNQGVASLGVGVQGVQNMFQGGMQRLGGMMNPNVNPNTNRNMSPNINPNANRGQSPVHQNFPQPQNNNFPMGPSFNNLNQNIPPPGFVPGLNMNQNAPLGPNVQNNPNMQNSPINMAR